MIGTAFYPLHLTLFFLGYRPLGLCSGWKIASPLAPGLSSALYTAFVSCSYCFNMA